MAGKEVGCDRTNPECCIACVCKAMVLVPVLVNYSTVKLTESWPVGVPSDMPKYRHLSVKFLDRTL